MGAGGIVVSAGSDGIVVFKPRRPRGYGYADCARDSLEKEDEAQTDRRDKQSRDGDRGHSDPDERQRHAGIPRSWPAAVAPKRAIAAGLGKTRWPITPATNARLPTVQM
jgi:hypothetical protein